MSATFTQFLREHAATHEAEAEAGKATVEEWRDAASRLFKQLRGWLAESDPDGIIQISEGVETREEPGLGSYSVPRLDLRVLGKSIRIIPKARNTIGTAQLPQKSAPQRATGRIDITDELLRSVMYRFPDDRGGDIWLIDDLRAGSSPKPLDQQAFETVLMSYLR